MTRGPSLRVAVVKPDWGIRGGAELVLDRLERALRADGHDVERRTIAVHALPRTPFHVGLPERAWNAEPEFFRYLSVLDAVERLDVSDADLVISTHAPSFAVDHPHHLSLFFHHLRVFYDLDEVFVKAGLAEDAELHAIARDKVRAIDQPHLDQVGWFSPNSEVTAARLEQFNGLTNATVHHAGVDPAAPLGAPLQPGAGAVLCVGRSEFSKRTELFVAAMHLVRDRRAVLAGDGGRLSFVRDLDRRLSEGTVDPASLTAADLWLNGGEVRSRPLWLGWRARPSTARSNVSLPGRVDRSTLDGLYRDAPCVIAPAFGEDYGLTAIEAMARGRPVIVCSDGGGLTTIVEHAVDGLVVEPTPTAIASGVQRIVEDPPFARRLGEAARDKAATFTWERTAAEWRTAIERVIS